VKVNDLWPAAIISHYYTLTRLGTGSTGVRTFVRIYFLISKTRPDRPWSQPIFYFTGNMCSFVVQAAGTWRWKLTSLQRQRWDWVELYLYSPSVPLWHVRDNFTLLIIRIVIFYVYFTWNVCCNS